MQTSEFIEKDGNWMNTGNKKEGPEVQMECWDAGSKHSYLYTENLIIAKKLLPDFSGATLYFRHEAVYAWQFIVPSRIISIVVRRLALTPYLSGGGESVKNDHMEIKELARLKASSLSHDASNVKGPHMGTAE